MIKKFSILFLFILQAHYIVAQDTLKTDLFNNYHKLSFQFGVSRYVGAETSALPSTLKYTFNNYISPHFGFYYDVLQTKHFNFKIGISALLVRDIIEFRIDKSQIENALADFGDETELITDNTWRFNLPLTAEYFINTDFGKLTLNGSFILGYHQEFGVAEGLDTVTWPNSNTTSLETVYSRKTAPWYANGQIGVGMYFPFKGWMLRTNIYYNMAFQKLYEGTFEFKNLQLSPDTSGNFSFKGDSFGIEFSIYLAKKIKKR